MIKKRINNVHRSDLQRAIKEHGKINTVEELLGYLYSDRTRYIIKDQWYKKPRQTVMNRINSLWVYPLFALLIPFRYVFFGDYHVSEDSLFGRIILTLVGDFE